MKPSQVNKNKGKTMPKTKTTKIPITKADAPANAKMSIKTPATGKIESSLKTEAAPKVENAPNAKILIKADNPTEIDVPKITPPKSDNTATQSKDEEKKDEREENLDVTQHVYEGFKNMWAFGCNIGVVKPLLKMTEGIAGTVLDASTGLKLENVDEGIKPKLAELDNGLINPMIGKVVSMVLPVFEKSDSIVRPFVMDIGPKILGPFGLFPSSPLPAIETGKLMEQKGESKVAIEKKEKEDEMNSPEMTPIRIPVQ